MFQLTKLILSFHKAVEQYFKIKSLKVKTKLNFVMFKLGFWWELWQFQILKILNKKIQFFKKKKR